MGENPVISARALQAALSFSAATAAIKRWPNPSEGTFEETIAKMRNVAQGLLNGQDVAKDDLQQVRCFFRALLDLKLSEMDEMFSRPASSGVLQWEQASLSCAS